MAHPRLTVETFDGSTQATIEGLLQLTVLPDGYVEINLADRHVEVERKGLRHVIRRSTDAEAVDLLKAGVLVQPKAAKR